ncbi:alpha-N-arabinofuranosidase [Arachidicoccus ginsenosidimutans]|uniref:family 43 glycosylhydrolase n=1 Tax=Arachidicoccus sp. BS20 TaxID=1850526 RepID=UPI0007F0BC5E|nr:family 43 glycosylhydrolase [Arachidicoccus sp. BS20]ANI88787.1 alpha-N-arabinofuranosidase [Arachidicoccus sp. BS20]
MKKFILISAVCFLTSLCIAQNPIIRNQYSADPSARVFGDSVYVYPSHDILATKEHGRIGWFCMEDYHVFSSANLTDWNDDGIVVSQYNVPWADSTAYSMWAPDCIFKNGKYYFYFPTKPKDTSNGNGFAIGVAVSDKPSGNFVPQPQPIKNVHGIDPNVFIDRDGQAYLYWAEGNIYAAKLKDNMLELASEPVVLKALPDKGLKEGPYMFERNGIYYLTYPHVADKTEQLEYAVSNNPLGPFKVTGVIMDESPDCWTNHHSIIQFKNQWYLFYHHDDYSPDFDKARSVRIDSLFFNSDGTIKKVIPTFRGVGLTNASKKIQIDRYTAKSNNGVSINFIDTANKFLGWKTTFTKANAWVQYSSIDFGMKPLKILAVRAFSATGGAIQIRADDINGTVIAEAKIPKGDDWKEIKATVKKYESGIHNLFIVVKNNSNVAIDWISFK